MRLYHTRHHVARLRDRGGTRHTPWTEVIANDARMQWEGLSIHYEVDLGDIDPSGGGSGADQHLAGLGLKREDALKYSYDLGEP